jgi:MoxR-like ATPase
MKNHLNFVGPKGVGKNKMTFHLSSLFDVDLFDISFSYETSRGDTQGANNFDENGKIKFQLSGLAQAMQRRCIIVCDEANFARAAMLSDFHSVLDFRRYMEITGYGRINLNEQCTFIITMNEGDGYEGTRPLNEAFRDRFHEVHFKSDPSQMTKVFMQECGISEADAKELNKLYKLIHQSVYQKAATAYIPEDYLSQRKCISAGKLYARGWATSIREAFEEEYLNTIGDPDIVETFKNLILLNYK